MKTDQEIIEEAKALKASGKSDREIFMKFYGKNISAVRIINLMAAAATALLEEKTT